MKSLFQFQTLDVKVLPESRTVVVYLDRPSDDNAFNVEMTFELERLGTWLSEHTEVPSVYVTSKTSTFSVGLKSEEIKSRGKELTLKWLSRLERVFRQWRELPQVTMINLKERASNIALEFALCFDFRICHANASLKFDHLQMGLLPQGGGLSLLAQEIPRGLFRKWLFTGQAITPQNLEVSGLIQIILPVDHNDLDQGISLLFSNFKNLPPIERIQLKNGLQHLDRPTFDDNLRRERTINEGTLLSQDWWSLPSDSCSIEKFKQLLKVKAGEEQVCPPS